MTTPSPPPPSADKPWWTDWSQYFCPGPRRRFSAAEMARAGNQPWPRGIDQYVAISVLIIIGISHLFGSDWRTFVWLWLGLGVLAALALWTTRQIWRQPTRMRMNTSTQFASLLFIAALLGIDQLELDRKLTMAAQLELAIFFMMTVAAWWFLTLYRVQQIEARLAELGSQDEQLRLTRRLATAQIHPHFVFNTLASLTHWVETQDARAAPLLREFNAYLRATLPMFEREAQPLRDELELVRHYLAIMQARLGERLQWQVDCEAEPTLQLPPGSLLTLVENAITHGIEPSLRGGRVAVRCRREAGRLLIEVEDSGEGLQQPFSEGLGLKNTRERLLAQHPGAQLRLSPNSEGGCTARMEIPA